MPIDKFVCNYPWTHFEVNNPNGDVTMCCNNNTVLGNVNEESVKEVWNNNRFRAIRKRMADDGAHAMCPDTCPVLNGFKKYQQIDWYGKMKVGSHAKINAAKNEEEYQNRETTLQSFPRWMRFAYSYACNLDCYHCYQREDAVQNTKLPDKFIGQVHELSKYYQILYFFGGEPFLYKPVINLMNDIETDPECRFHFVTNGTLLTKTIMNTLERSNIGHFAISLDAATETSFDLLRRRGANFSWDTVITNIDKIAQLQSHKNFSFSISMTVNKVNHDEIEKFIDLGIKFRAEPLVMLVANPYQTYGFQKEFLQFTNTEFATMYDQIDNALPKVQAAEFREAEAALISLKRVIENHRKLENQPSLFLMLRILRRAFHYLPKKWHHPLRKHIYLPLRGYIGVSLNN